MTKCCPTKFYRQMPFLAGKRNQDDATHYSWGIANLLSKVPWAGPEGPLYTFWIIHFE